MNLNLRSAIAVAAVAVGAMLSLGATPAAAEGAAAISATPSSGLVNGQSIEVAVTGFGAGANLYVGQCAYLTVDKASPVCDLSSSQQVVADAAGAGSAPLTVHSSFEGTDVATGESVGLVDCGTVAGGCVVNAVSEDFSAFAVTDVSFG
ncbi:MAG TPA: enediyne antibiotic chromoprotein [Catenuloplanes sp.]